MPVASSWEVTGWWRTTPTTTTRASAKSSVADLHEVFSGAVEPGLHPLDQTVTAEDLAEMSPATAGPVVVDLAGVADKAGLLDRLAEGARFPGVRRPQLGRPAGRPGRPRLAGPDRRLPGGARRLGRVRGRGPGGRGRAGVGGDAGGSRMVVAGHAAGGRHALGVADLRSEGPRSPAWSGQRTFNPEIVGSNPTGGTQAQQGTTGSMASGSARTSSRRSRGMAREFRVAVS